MTIVPFSIRPFVTVSMRALVRAQLPARAGAWEWASRGRASATPRRKPLASGGPRRMQGLLVVDETAAGGHAIVPPAVDVTAIITVMLSAPQRQTSSRPVPFPPGM